MRKLVESAAVAAMLIGGLGSTAVPAAASQPADGVTAQVRCGGTIKRLPDDNHDNKRWDIFYRNCGSHTVKRKVDIAWAADLPCKTIKPGKTAKWFYTTGTLGPDYPRSIKTC